MSLALQLLFPAGFMAAGVGQATHGLPVVICTGQGQVTVDSASLPGAHRQAPAKTMAACPFAGHAVADTGAAPIVIATPAAYALPSSSVAPSAAAPGLGLAAPPPPSQGPPAQA